MPLSHIRRIVHHLHARVGTYIAIACNSVTRGTVGPARLTIVLAVIVIALTTILVFGANVGFVVNEVISPIAETLAIFMDE